MDPIVRHAIEQKLRSARARLLAESIAAKGEVDALAESRGTELAEAASHERPTALTASLELRAKHDIEEIDAALLRLADGRYGTCLECGCEIAIARLQLVPATRFCLRCARRQPRAPEGDGGDGAPASHDRADS